MGEQETAKEMRERLEAMAVDHGETWDLSDNDRAALSWVLAALDAATAERDRAIKLAVSAMESKHYYTQQAAVLNVADYVGVSRDLVRAAAGLDALSADRPEPARAGEGE